MCIGAHIFCIYAVEQIKLLCAISWEFVTHAPTQTYAFSSMLNARAVLVAGAEMQKQYQLPKEQSSTHLIDKMSTWTHAAPSLPMTSCLSNPQLSTATGLETRPRMHRRQRQHQEYHDHPSILPRPSLRRNAYLRKVEYRKSRRAIEKGSTVTSRRTAGSYAGGPGFVQNPHPSFCRCVRWRFRTSLHNQHHLWVSNSLITQSHTRSGFADRNWFASCAWM